MTNPLHPLNIEITEADIIRHFTLKEAFSIVYLPIVLTKSAMEYADFARRICVERRLSFNCQCREIRWALNEYERRNIYHYRTMHSDDLAGKVDDFFDQADNALQGLWHTIKDELSRQYPDAGDYDLLANIYMAVILLDYVGKLECAISRKIRQRTGKPYAACIPKECNLLRRTLMQIAGAYRMENTPTLRTAIVALAEKANGMIKVTVTH